MPFRAGSDAARGVGGAATCRTVQGMHGNKCRQGRDRSALKSRHGPKGAPACYEFDVGRYGEFGFFNIKPLFYKVNYRSFIIRLFPFLFVSVYRRSLKSGPQFCEDRNNPSESDLAAGVVPRISVG